MTTILRTVLVAVTATLLTACGLSDQQKADYAAVERSGVSPAIYDQMVHGDPLTPDDIIALSQARVSDAIIVRYIRDQGTVYSLSSRDFSRLEKAGVSPSVVDYMAHTGYPPVYPYPYASPYGYPYPYPPVSIGFGFGFGGGRCWR